ncbi:MAG TPA: hypothetical protein VKI18_16990 [Albitalea sp.]|nr:hypothetical protein [Albitalea sp.]
MNKPSSPDSTPPAEPKAPPPEPKRPPCAVDLAEESVAGEEDPGASMDLDVDLPPAEDAR